MSHEFSKVPSKYIVLNTASLSQTNNDDNCNNNNFLCTKYQCFHIFLCLKLYFPSPFFHVDPFHVFNTFLSHSGCYFLYSRISRSFFFFFQVDTIPKFFEVVFLHSFFARDHTSSTVCILGKLKPIFNISFSLIS